MVTEHRRTVRVGPNFTREFYAFFPIGCVPQKQTRCSEEERLQDKLAQ